MIRKVSNQRDEYIDGCCGGKGKIKLHHMLEKGDFKGKCWLFAKGTMPPGTTIGLHPHVEDEEIYYILKGKGLVTDDDDVEEVGPGDAIVTGAGSKHALENIGSDDLEFIGVVYYVN